MFLRTSYFFLLIPQFCHSRNDRIIQYNKLYHWNNIIYFHAISANEQKDFDLLTFESVRGQKCFKLAGGHARYPTIRAFIEPEIVRFPIFIVPSSFSRMRSMLARNSVQSNILHGGTGTGAYGLNTFSELIIGSAATRSASCQSLQIHRDLLVKSTRRGPYENSRQRSFVHANDL